MLEATQTAKGESVFASSKEWKGHVVNGTYPLRQYIGGSAHSAVFLTEIPGQNAQRAAIKLIAPSGDTQVQIGGDRLSAPERICPWAHKTDQHHGCRRTAEAFQRRTVPHRSASRFD